MTTRVAKWGNSLGLRLPKSLTIRAQIAEGDRVEVSARNGTIVIRSRRPRYSLAELSSKISAKNRHGEHDWGPATGREGW